MSQAKYYGAYLSSTLFNGQRMWMVMYISGGYVYDRLFNDCPFSVKRQIAESKDFRK